MIFGRVGHGEVAIAVRAVARLPLSAAYARRVSRKYCPAFPAAMARPRPYTSGKTCGSGGR